MQEKTELGGRVELDDESAELVQTLQRYVQNPNNTVFQDQAF